MKTRSYLAAMVAAILLPIVFLSAWGLSQLLEKERRARLAGLEEVVRAISLAIDEEIADAEGALRVLANTEDLHKENFAALHALVNRSFNSGDSWVVIYDSDGRVVAHSQSPLTKNIAGVMHPWVPVALKADKLNVSNLRDGLLTRTKVVSVNIPVTTASDKKYLVSQVFQASHFTKLLYAKGLPNTTVVGVFDADGITIARNINAEKFVGTRVKAALYEASAKQHSGRIQNVTRDGFMAYDTFVHTNRTPWVVAMAVPVQEIDGQAQAAVSYAALALCIIFMISATAVIFLARRINSSFNLAVAASRELAAGRVPQSQASGVEEADLLQAALHEAGVKLREEDSLRRQLESEREQLLQSEQEARKLAENQNNAKDEFLAMLAHELRNPLAPISAAAQILKISGKSEHNIRRSSEIIVRQVQHLTELINDLLDVSRVTRGLVELKKQKIDIKSVVSLAIEQSRPVIEARAHNLHIHMGAAHGAVLGDQTRLVQVISNILNNAAKYTPVGGEITLAVEAGQSEVTIRISDNGVGIDPALLPHIFELFRQARRTPDRSQGGLGLGLALVRSITALHGGRVEAHSEGLNQGSCFSVSLPLFIGEDAAHSASEDSGDAVIKPVHILLVDDNVDAARSLAALLEAKGHRLTVLHDAHSALSHPESDAVQVYILDIGLPDMDGYALVRSLKSRASNANAVFIALTGYGQTHDKEMAFAAGFNYHFVKPIDIERLDTILVRIEVATPDVA